MRARRVGYDGEHFLLKSGHESYQLWLPDPPSEGSFLAAVLPLDEAAPQRAAAATSFWRHATARRALAVPLKHRDKLHICKTLRALDGHLSGAAYRVIAESLFGPARIAAEPWKTASLRDATIRLVRKGVGLMRGGYRKLLRK